MNDDVIVLKTKLQRLAVGIPIPTRARPDPITTFPKMKDVNVNPNDGRTIADAFDNMKNNPTNPKVSSAYGDFIKETEGQFNDLKRRGLNIEAVKPGAGNPYKTSGDMHRDLENNNHLFYFPTEQGFGNASKKLSDSPMLKVTNSLNEKGKKMVANDVFRVVHDVNGHHLGEQASFGPRGEQQAFLTHKRLYSTNAQRALFTETAGQNNWVNFNKKTGESNRKNPKSTIFADQKAGLMPDKIIFGKWHI